MHTNFFDIVPLWYTLTWRLWRGRSIPTVAQISAMNQCFVAWVYSHSLLQLGVMMVCCPKIPGYQGSRDWGFEFRIQQIGASGSVEIVMLADAIPDLLAERPRNFRKFA